MLDLKKRTLHSGFFIVAILMCLFACVGCAEEGKDKKYDVAIKVANNYGQEWIFTPDVDELHYEFEYTGEEMTFGIDEYYVYGDPQVGDRWLDCAGASVNWFGGSSPLFTSPTGEQYSTEIIKEKGVYVIPFYTRKTDWNYRRIDLYVTVK